MMEKSYNKHLESVMNLYLNDHNLKLMQTASVVYETKSLGKFESFIVSVSGIEVLL